MRGVRGVLVLASYHCDRGNLALHSSHKPSSLDFSYLICKTVVCQDGHQELFQFNMLDLLLSEYSPGSTWATAF